MRYHQTGEGERSQRRLLNLNTLTTTRRAVQLGAKNCRDILLQVREVGDEFKTETLVAAFAGRRSHRRRTTWCLGIDSGDDSAGDSDRNRLAGDANQVRHRRQLERHVLAGLGKQNTHVSAEGKLLALKAGDRFLQSGC